MPHPTAFLEGFGLCKGTALTHKELIIRLNKVNIQHIVLTEYQKYKFPLTLEVVTPCPDKKAVMEALADFCGEKVVYSQYGNPYRCFLQDWTIQVLNTLIPAPPFSYIVKATGYGERIHRVAPSIGNAKE